MYRILAGEKFKGVRDFPAESVWRQMIPTKVCAFMWLVAHKRILTLDNLKKRGWQLANTCELCGVEEESIDHILSQCGFVVEIWTRMQRVCGALDLSGGDFITIIRRWSLAVDDSVESCVRFGALHAVSWQVWLERNRRVFKGTRLQARGVTRKAVRDSLDWAIACGKLDKGLGLSWLAGRQHLL
ncbi:unnamed protein product [Linum trigynum]|uniref:Reverse transcriptase zinc-binding domain-containing protein n=1 Tax=Linum trigynum TaxID=586398 RepID=A0AAV2DCU0_9ROSI